MQGIRGLHDRVDAFFRAAIQACPSEFACGPGCAACCRVDLTVFPVEAERVRAAFRALPDDARRAAAERARAGLHCVMLDAEDRCVVYDDRPVICRSHGVAILVDGRVDSCPRNYRYQAPRREHVLDVERLNEVLVRLDVANGGRGERVRLADLVLEHDGGNGA